MQSENTQTITATITARGRDTTAPDRPDAVDADIWVGQDYYLCAVTLLEDRGTLSTWGEPHQWCDDWGAIVDCAAEWGIDTVDIVGEIVAAVNAADREDA